MEPGAGFPCSQWLEADPVVRYPIVIEADCTGCDVCSQLCPDVFEINEELIAIVVNSGADSEHNIQQAIDLCPEGCIRWSQME